MLGRVHLREVKVPFQSQEDTAVPPPTAKAEEKPEDQPGLALAQLTHTSFQLLASNGPRLSVSALPVLPSKNPPSGQ